jgi:L-ascorbate metabolism protein UlaG (beta-lactamase superfamily)
MTPVGNVKQRAVAAFKFLNAKRAGEIIMKNTNVYLKQNVVAEPLFNQWYAWSYLISPSTGPLYVANLHVKIMESFISAPQIHADAYKNPEMIGGPFINYDPSKVGEIDALLKKTKKEQSHMLEFAEAIKSLDKMLSAEASGYSMIPLYAKIPGVLSGYVELVYDLHNSPSFRLIEGLLYKSRYYDPALQSMALSVINDDYRPFVFSTPRLDSPDCLHINMPFKSEGLDEMFKMKYTAQPFGHIKEALNVEEKDEPLFSSFFTEEPPPAPDRYTGDGVRIRYISHACILIESNGTSILTDPVVSYKYDTRLDRFTFADLPERIDYILITHNHQDHCMFETLLQLRHKAKCIIVPRSNGAWIDPSLRLIMHAVGFDNVREIDEMETIQIDGGTITGLPFLGEHCDLNIRTKTAYAVSLKGKSILIGADSCNVSPKLYQHIHDAVGDIDVLFLGMECDGAPLTWLYGPLLINPVPRRIDQSRRLSSSNFEEAINLVEQLNPKQVYVYAMGLEPWLVYLTSLQYEEDDLPMVDSRKFVETCRRRDIETERLFLKKEILLP